jgi:hypothetical protein
MGWQQDRHFDRLSGNVLMVVFLSAKNDQYHTAQDEQQEHRLLLRLSGGISLPSLEHAVCMVAGGLSSCALHQIRNKWMSEC